MVIGWLQVVAGGYRVVTDLRQVGEHGRALDTRAHPAAAGGPVDGRSGELL